MDLAAFASLIAIVAGTTHFWRRSRGAVKIAPVGAAGAPPTARGAGRGPSLRSTGLDPALRLLVDDLPRRKLVGTMRQGAPARTIHRKALKTSRSSCRRCGASGVIRVRYGATNAHSSSVTSVGYGLRGIAWFPCRKPTKS